MIKLSDIKKSAEELKPFLRLFADMIFTHKKDGTISDFIILNNEIQLFVPEDQIIGTSVTTLPLKPYHKEEILQAIKTTLETRNTSVVDYYVEFNNAFKYFRATISFYNEDEVISLVKEVTQNIKALVSLKENEELFRILVNNVSDAIILIDENDTIKLWSDTCKKIFGFSRSEAIGKNINELLELKKLESKEKEQTFYKLAPTYYMSKHKYGVFKLIDIKKTNINYFNRPHTIIIVKDIEELARSYSLLYKYDEFSKKIEDTLTELFFLNVKDFEEFLKIITKMASETLNVDRVGVWFIDESTYKLKNFISYQYSTNTYFVDTNLDLEKINDYFENFLKKRVIVVNNVFENGQVTSLKEYFIRYNIKSMLDAIIRIPEKPIGVICFEHTGQQRKWESLEISFATTVADKIATLYQSVELSNKTKKIDLIKEELKKITDKVENINQLTQQPQLKEPLEEIHQLLYNIGE